VSYEAHRQAWVDAATLADDKWEHVFGSLIPDTRDQIAAILGLDRGETITFAPNTHEFLMRLFSCFEPPVRILSTDSEFHSFTRQSLRWEESGLAQVDRVPARPFDTFAERFTTQARFGAPDLIYLSHVFFDSGFVVPELDRIVSSVSDERAFFVVDGYHSFMALPVDLGAIQDRAFFIAGGYKYAMSGEGVCFMHAPAGYGPRPVDTGWYAGFGQLEEGVDGEIRYSNDGDRFAGATYDPSGIYRMSAVLSWLSSQGADPAWIHTYAGRLQGLFLESADLPGELLPPQGVDRGNFLTFRTDDAARLYKRLHDQKVITDYRGDRLRIGFGVYQDRQDVEDLVSVVAGIVSP
ncbi:MAG: aminotransferase class V-fold PLP-dependent enzyme, partial [Acidimicrobiia bacterium]|jgi:selenocysteine lyase/cysteine desulfurase